MGLIEEAAKRLEQLRRAGAEIPEPRPFAPPAIPEPPPAIPELPPVTPVMTPAPTSVMPAPGEPIFPAPTAPSAAPAEAAPPVPAKPPRTRATASARPQIELNLDALTAAGFITPHSPRSQIADEYRIIKRPLLANAMGKSAAPVQNGNLIMVTSAVPNEGKTFSAINLAMSIAMELDNTVMLVDADVAHPSVLNVLNLPATRGLLDVLLDDTTDLSHVLLKTNVEKLTLLPAGTQHPRATELLASDAMAELLHEMASRYSDRIIIFDSPPLLVTTEAHVLASHVGQVVMVTRAASTLRSQVKQALAAIEACPVKLLLLNRARPDPMGTYGYGYGRYGYGYGQEEAGK